MIWLMISVVDSYSWFSNDSGDNRYSSARFSLAIGYYTHPLLRLYPVSSAMPFLMRNSIASGLLLVSMNALSGIPHAG